MGATTTFKQEQWFALVPLGPGPSQNSRNILPWQTSNAIEYLCTRTANVLRKYDTRLFINGGVVRKLEGPGIQRLKETEMFRSSDEFVIIDEIFGLVIREVWVIVEARTVMRWLGVRPVETPNLNAILNNVSALPKHVGEVMNDNAGGFDDMSVAFDHVDRPSDHMPRKTSQQLYDVPNGSMKLLEYVKSPDQRVSKAKDNQAHGGRSRSLGVPGREASSTNDGEDGERVWHCAGE